MNQENKFLSPWIFVKGFALILGIIGTLIAIYFGIDKMIEEKTSNPSFIRKIAKNVRPWFIFDSKGSVLIDMGGFKPGVGPR